MKELGLYCSINNHPKCSGRGCPCACHDGGTVTMPDLEKCAHCPRQIKPGAAMEAHLRASHPHVLGSQSPPPSPEPELVTGALVWEEPPPERKGRGFLIHSEQAAKVIELKRHPGEWARFRTFKSPTGAGGAMARLKKDFPDIEFVGRRVREGAISSAVFARYVEPEEA